MPDVADSLREAIASLRANRLADAHALLERILAGDPGDAEALHLSGIVLYRRGDFGAAIARITKAMAREPRNAGYQANLGQCPERRIRRPATRCGWAARS